MTWPVCLCRFRYTVPNLPDPIGNGYPSSSRISEEIILLYNIHFIYIICYIISCVCGFSQNSAAAIYKRMGLTGEVRWFSSNSWGSRFQNKLEIRMRNVECTGSEWRSDYSFVSAGYNCSHNYDVCYKTLLSTILSITKQSKKCARPLHVTDCTAVQVVYPPPPPPPPPLVYSPPTHIT